MSQRKSGPHARAASASIGHFGQYILITLEQLLLRAIALSPLIYALVSGQFFGLRREYVLAAALLSALVLWTLLALPARLRMGAQLSGWFGAQINAGSWSDRLAKGLVPFAKARLGVDDGMLGMLLLCLGIGSVLAIVVITVELVLWRRRSAQEPGA